ncbi:MAG: hypothetical protein FWG26_07915 [Betaproteobacteria bacterium]|nr:hypothetical protein [Betaproteobacteria bacterium]
MQCGASLQTGNALTLTDPTATIPPDSDNDSTVLLSTLKTPETLQEPDTATPPDTDNDSTVLLSTLKAPETPQEPATATQQPPDSNKTILLSELKATSLLQKPLSTPPPQPDAMTTASTVPTMIFSGNNAKHGHRRKKNKKARGHAKPLRPNTLAEPFIPANTASTVQDEPASPLAAETFVFPERDDRIAAKPSWLESSPVPTQSIRKSIHPAALGIAALVLIVFLGGLLWWNSGETESSGALPQTLSSEPLPDTEPPTPGSSTENTLASNPKPVVEPAVEQVSISEPGSEPELMSIPSLPMNQQQGRHNNQHNLAETSDSEVPYPLPTPTEPTAPIPTQTPVQTPARTSAQTPAQTSAPALIPMPTPTQAATATPEPAEMLEPEPVEMYQEMADAPPPTRAPARTATNPQPATPPWLWQMRDDLSNCRSFFCRERVRRQYCTSQWSDLPECRGASL